MASQSIGVVYKIVSIDNVQLIEIENFDEVKVNTHGSSKLLLQLNLYCDSLPLQSKAFKDYILDRCKSNIQVKYSEGKIIVSYFDKDVMIVKNKQINIKTDLVCYIPSHIKSVLENKGINGE